MLKLLVRRILFFENSSSLNFSSESENVNDFTARRDGAGYLTDKTFRTATFHCTDRCHRIRHIRFWGPVTSAIFLLWK